MKEVNPSGTIEHLESHFWFEDRIWYRLGYQVQNISGRAEKKILPFFNTGAPRIVQFYGTEKKSHCSRTIYVVNDQNRKNETKKLNFCLLHRRSAYVFLTKEIL